MLAARTAGSIDIDTQLGRIDLNVDVVVDLWRYENGCERGMSSIARIEGRLAHQAMHARFGAQPAVGIFTHDMNRCALDACHFARRCFDDLDLEAMRFSPAQVHSQYHFRPVLSLGTTGAGLDVEVRVVGVHVTRKHAPELEACNLLLESAEIGGQLVDRVLVAFFQRHFEQLAGVTEAGLQLVEADNHVFQLRAFLPERLGAPGIVPYIGFFEFPLDLGQAFRLAIVVKDTSSTHRSVQRGRLSSVLPDSFPWNYAA